MRFWLVRQTTERVNSFILLPVRQAEAQDRDDNRHSKGELIMATKKVRFEDVKEAYGRMLICLRTASGLSVEQFADAIGLDRKEYLDQENGGFGCSLKSLVELAWNTNLSPETLFSTMLSFLSKGPYSSSYSLDQCQLFRLAWVDPVGRVRDVDVASYQTVSAACADLPSRNALRNAQGLPPVTRISAYALLGHMIVAGPPLTFSLPASDQAAARPANGRDSS